MKITCRQQSLLKGLGVVGHAVSSKSALPILANILMATDRGRLKVSATNLELGINCWVDAEIFEEGTTTVPAKTFTDLIASLHFEQIELTVAEEGSFTTNVRSTGSNANIKGMDPADFPLIPGIEESDQILTLPADILKEMIAQVTIASADDDSRPVLTGVLVSLEHENLSFAAADAFRLALRNTRIEPGITEVLEAFLVPAKTLRELARILPAEEDVQLIVSPRRNQVLFHTEHIDLVSRLLEGTFPNVQAAIPKEYMTRAVMDTKEFAAAVKSVIPFARDSSNIMRVTMTNTEEHGKGTLTVEATAEDVGANVTTIAAALEGPNQEIIFNVRYLTDVLAIMDASEVALEVVNAARPGVVRPVSATDFTYVIMPMSTNR